MVGEKDNDLLILNNFNNKNNKFYFTEQLDVPSSRAKVPRWRISDKTRTSAVEIVLCLNLGVDPPGLIKINPCACLEAWFDPASMKSSNAVEVIGNRLQQQYEQWRNNAHYKLCLDPSVDEIRKKCLSLRKKIKDDRFLFHYNGHGVPKPTNHGEVWVGSPAIYVFDCSSAGTALYHFKSFAMKRETEFEEKGADGANPPLLFRDCILFAACSHNQNLPMSPEYPADMFTACLTTPIKMALKWCCSHTIIKGITPSMIDNIPGDLMSRQSPLGELNWIFTSITDSIAWSVLPHSLFQKYYRQDLLVATLFRNFFLADRIMRSAGCTPISSPPLPSTHTHSMWQMWDLTVDIFLSQLLITLANPSSEFKHSSFFTEQLTAFEVWLESANEQKPPPMQLPIVLQALLSTSLRFRALVLLSRYVDLGPWAVKMVLVVGMLPYLLKLLKNTGSDHELRKIMTFIWVKILSFDKRCQLDLVKESAHKFFIEVLQTQEDSYDQRAMAAYALSVIVNNSRPGQSACLSDNLISVCLQQFGDPNSTVRRWAVICLAKLWENFGEAKSAAILEGAHEKLCTMLQDEEPGVRAAVVYALGTFIGGSEGNEKRISIELNIGLALPLVFCSDSSPLVRRELVVTLYHLIVAYNEEVKFVLNKEKSSSQSGEEKRNKNQKTRNTSSPKSPAKNTVQRYSLLWKLIVKLCNDPHPDVSSLANDVVKFTQDSQEISVPPGSPGSEMNSPKLRGCQRDTFNTSGNFRNPSSILYDDYLTSTFYESSSNFYSCPIIEVQDDIHSPKNKQLTWKSQQNHKIVQESRELSSIMDKIDTPVSMLDNVTGEVSALQFHPFESTLIMAENQKTLIICKVWNWETGQKMHSFSNSSSNISSIKIINEHDSGLLLVGSNDGVVKVWRGIESPDTLKMITSWCAIPEAPNSAMLMEWQQDQGRLLVAGDVGFIRVWDAERELSVQDIPTERSVGVSAISSINGKTIVAGFKDGSVALFDVCLNSKFSQVGIYNEHKHWIVGTALPKARNNLVISCDIAGEINFWTLGYPKPHLGTSTNEHTSSLAVHDFAPVLACGSHMQQIRIMDFDGKEKNNIYYHEGFLRKRIGPVSCLHFHPYKLLLAAGGSDSMVPIYSHCNMNFK